jgi:hypothetical protein
MKTERFNIPVCMAHEKSFRVPVFFVSVRRDGSISVGHYLILLRQHQAARNRAAWRHGGLSQDCNNPDICP